MTSTLDWRAASSLENGCRRKSPRKPLGPGAEPRGKCMTARRTSSSVSSLAAGAGGRRDASCRTDGAGNFSVHEHTHHCLIQAFAVAEDYLANLKMVHCSNHTSTITSGKNSTHA